MCRQTVDTLPHTLQASHVATCTAHGQEAGFYPEIFLRGGGTKLEF